jgi:hypothetical protein
MSANSSASKPPPLCYCGVRARVRHSWTSSNPTRKWYGCVKYKVRAEPYFVFYLCVTSFTTNS